MTKSKQAGTVSLALVLIVMGYLLTAALYAWQTPKWQAPDEPAHYNYIVALAETGQVPVLQAGDYPAAYLEEIKARKFPSDMSIAPIRYEFHQPPLYYALGALVYRATAQQSFAMQFLALRLLSVLLGAILVVVAYKVVMAVYPDDRTLGLVTAAFVATVPMHVAMTAAINNDTMAELLIALTLWLLLRPASEETALRMRLATGLVLGLGLLTKITTLVAFLAVPVVLWLRYREHATVEMKQGKRWNEVVKGLAVIWGVAVLIGGPWLVRNALVYGHADIFGLGRHNAVVVGQPRTAEWLAQYGPKEYAQRFLSTTFHSFWGQFGWMGVPMNARVYDFLLMISFFAVLGCLLYVWDIWRVDGASRPPELMIGWITLGTVLVLTVLSYLWYNLTFVQHQGRYLFPALIPIGMFFSVGLRDLIDQYRWPLLATLWVLGMFALDVYSLYGFILPQLR